MVFCTLLADEMQNSDKSPESPRRFQYRFTFRSRALQAWIADELNNKQIGRVLLRGSQAVQIGVIIGIAVGVFVGSGYFGRPFPIWPCHSSWTAASTSYWRCSWPWPCRRKGSAHPHARSEERES